MNRCTPQAPRATFPHRCGFAVSLAFALCALSLAASGQVTNPRPFPPQAERGLLQVTQPPDLLLNGKPDRLSPGARILGTNNMLVLSGQLIGQKAVVNFVREPNGQVHQVWILSEAEAALKLPTSP
jgi:hypothetical protein